MAGLKVTRELLDMRSAEAILAVREAVAKIETINAFLATVPSGGEGGDPLTDPEGAFKYNEDEAYLMRYLFEQLHTVRPQVDPILEAGRKLTGLE